MLVARQIYTMTHQILVGFQQKRDMGFAKRIS